MDYLSIYSNAFSDSNYSDHEHIQYNHTLNYITRFYNKDSHFSVIDIGSGRGQIIKLITDNFKNCKITSVDLDKFNDYDVYEFIKCDLSKESDRNKLNNKYDILICTDVLEHLSKDFIKDIFTTFTRLSKVHLLAIAYHSDIYNGIELHTIQEPIEWWNNLLNNYYKINEFSCFYDNRLFYFYCINK